MMKFWKMIVVLGILGVLGLYIVGIYLTRPKQAAVVAPHTDVVLQNVTFPSKSDSVLHGWFIQGELDKAGILLMHGLRSNRLQMLRRAEVLNKAGYSVLLFDFQGHGESKGRKITFGFLESLDAEAGFDYLKTRVKNNKVGVIGVSLGGAAALLGTVKNRADAMILESVYPSIEQAIKNRLEVKIGTIGVYLLPILTMQLKVQLGIKPEQLRPISQIGKSSESLLIIGGEKDERTTQSETIELYNKAKEPKELWLVKGAKHIDFDVYIPNQYFKKILSFFDKNI